MGLPQAIVGGIGLLQYPQQGAIGKYNQSVPIEMLKSQNKKQKD